MDESTGEKELRERVQSIPLLQRLEKCQEMIANMCSAQRPPKMCIPVQWYDEDQYIIQTLKDAVELIGSVGDPIERVTVCLTDAWKWYCTNCSCENRIYGYPDESQIMMCDQCKSLRKPEPS